MADSRFILGVIAGAMLEGDVIAYEADYPMYGIIASINAFALGVQMTRPCARVKLFWTECGRELVELQGINVEKS